MFVIILWLFLSFQLKLILSNSTRFYQNIYSKEQESHDSGKKWKTRKPPHKSYGVYLSFYCVSEDLGLSLERILQVLLNTECDLISPASTSLNPVEFCPLQWHRSQVISFLFHWVIIVLIILFLELFIVAHAP